MTGRVFDFTRKEKQKNKNEGTKDHESVILEDSF
jgi:hypothetical protein